MEYRFHSEQQGINRAIPYLTDKLHYLTSYEFDSENLELVRLKRITETELALGLRLIEIGEMQKGRQMLWAGQPCSTAKAWTGLALSLLPTKWRRKAFMILRQLRN